MFKIIKILIFTLGVVNSSYSQKIYKTPFGKKYHLETCRMVKNVSKEILEKSSILNEKLDPCKICKPPVRNFKVDNSQSNKAVGTQKQSVRCKGFTLKKTRCKHKTSLANGYCYQHTDQKK